MASLAKSSKPSTTDLRPGPPGGSSGHSSLRSRMGPSVVHGKQARVGEGLLRDRVRTEEGVVSSSIFNDSEISRLELERIFTRSWLFVAHQSEIPHVGDFVTRSMGEDPVIVWRGQDGRDEYF